MPRLSLKAWLAKKFDARYVKRTELDKTVARIEKKVAASQADVASLKKRMDKSQAEIAALEKSARESQSDVREAQRMAREGGFSIESLLVSELELQQQIDAITGEGL